MNGRDILDCYCKCQAKKKPGEEPGSFNNYSKDSMNHFTQGVIMNHVPSEGIMNKVATKVNCFFTGSDRHDYV